MSSETIEHLLSALPSIITAIVALYIAFRKMPTEVKQTKAETNKTEAETESLHAQIADRWAEHVIELQNQVRALILDVAQVRRENETYRAELEERDMVIANLKDWAERLLRQLRKHAPNVKPEEYIDRHTQKQSINVHDAAADNGF